MTLIGLCMLSCMKKAENQSVVEPASSRESDSMFVVVMKAHLDAVSDKDLDALSSTLSPNGEMQLILPDSEIINSTEKFMEYHREWFKDTTWTFETKILNTTITSDFGMAITEIVYKEPNRNGKPYFNRMTVSYDLKKINGNWYVIKDHASSNEKSSN